MGIKGVKEYRQVWMQRDQPVSLKSTLHVGFLSNISLEEFEVSVIKKIVKNKMK